MGSNYQKKDRVLGIKFNCPVETLSVGDPVRIASDLTVAGVSSSAHRDIIGSVSQYDSGNAYCTVDTSFNFRREREAYAQLSVGPFVWGAANKPVAWTLGGFATVTGSVDGPFVFAKANFTGTGTENFTITAAAGGSVTTGNGPFTFETGVSDAFKIKIGAAASQTFTLTGSAQTAAQVASQFSAAVGFTATAVGVTVVFQATTVTDALEIEAVAADSYTVLGLTAGVHAIVTGNNKFKYSIDSGTPVTITLTAGTRTAAQVATDIDAGAGIVAAASEGAVTVTASDSGKILNLLTVADDCYTALGFTADDYEATDTISITVGSGDPQVYSFAAGSTAIASVVNAVNLNITDITATASGNQLVLTCDALGVDFTIDAVDNDAYTLLGLTAEEITNTDPSHSELAIGGIVVGGPAALSLAGTVKGPYAIVNGVSDAFKLAIGSGEDQTFDLTAGTARTATQIAADLNATGVGFEATVSDDCVVLTATSPWNDIIIKTVSNNAYGLLGFTVATYSASKTVQTLEY